MDTHIATFTLRVADIRACPFAIIHPAHYRPDGSCRCDEPAHRQEMIRDWGYTPADFAGIPVQEAPHDPD